MEHKELIIEFKEQATYKMAINGFDCPHCGAAHGNHVNYGDTNNGRCKIIDKYEIPIDVEFMHKHTGYSWTEDCKCGNCGKMYSRGNGC